MKVRPKEREMLLITSLHWKIVCVCVCTIEQAVGLNEPGKQTVIDVKNSAVSLLFPL